MRRLPLLTKDGSHTVQVPDLNATYHSIHGAITESQHVFISAGLKYRLQFPHGNPLKVLEMGFGTGLNALMTCLETLDSRDSVKYTAVEAYPLERGVYESLNLAEKLERPEAADFFNRLHAAPGDTPTSIHHDFTIIRKNRPLQKVLQERGEYDLVYYDAFAPSCQPELWTPEIFQMIAGKMVLQSVLVTYCSKGDVRRALQKAGLDVEKLAGPPGKREMLRAVKP